MKKSLIEFMCHRKNIHFPSILGMYRESNNSQLRGIPYMGFSALSHYWDLIESGNYYIPGVGLFMEKFIRFLYESYKNRLYLIGIDIM